MYSKINSKNWAEFKKWRQNEIDKVESSDFYKKCDNLQRLGLNNLLHSHIRYSHCAVQCDLGAALKYVALKHVPSETFKECYKWLLNNGRIL